MDEGAAVVAGTVPKQEAELDNIPF
jgi:hypothetical protein